MAALQWRPIEAPHLSTRDVALAGEGLTQSFQQLGQMLANRELTLRQQATDEQAAQVLLAKDETGLDAAIARALGTNNKRVNARAIADLANTQRSTLLERKGQEQANWLQGDQIKDKEALTAFGELIPKLTDLYYNDKTNERQAMLDGLSGEEGFNRFLTQKFNDFQGAFQTGVGDRETKRSALAREAGDAADRALRGRELSLREKEKTQNDAAFQLGRQMAQEFRNLSPQDAAVMASRDPRMKGLTASQIGQVNAGLGSLLPGLQTLTEQEATGAFNSDKKAPNVVGLRSQAKLLASAAEAANAGTRADLLRAQPELGVVAEAAKNPGKGTTDSAAALDQATAALFPGNLAQRLYGEGYSHDEIVAAANVAGGTGVTDYLAKVPSLGLFMPTAEDRIRRTLERTREVNSKGGAAYVDAVLEAKTAPVSGASAGLARELAAIERDAAANNGRIDQARYDRWKAAQDKLNAQLDAATRKKK